MNPIPPAHCLCCSSSTLVGFMPLKDWTAERSSSIHVFPMENVPLTFSLALCMRTRPDLRTATMMRRGFFASGLALGGGGNDGYAASSMIRICVMYDSSTETISVSYFSTYVVASWFGAILRDPSSSFLPKQLSIILRFSSSNFSALLIPLLPLTPPGPIWGPSIRRSRDVSAE